MATFGTYKGSVSPLMTWYATYDYSRTSNSNVQVTMTVVGEINNHSSTSWMGTGASVIVTATVNGSSQTYAIKESSNAWYGNTNNPRSCSFTFNVTSPTAGASIPVSYSVAGSGYTAAAKVPTQSTSFSSPALLYTASKPSQFSGKMGGAVGISINPQSSDMTHTLSYSFGSAGGQIATGVGGSYTWYPSKDLAYQIPSSNSGTGTLTCTTYIGSTPIGTESTTFTLTVPDDAVSTCSLSVSRVRGSEPSEWGVYVQGYSKASCTANVSCPYGSWVTSYKISGGGYSGTSSSLDTGILRSSGTNRFTLTITDSRGNTVNADPVDITVEPYTPPSFSSVSAYRSDASKNKSNNGTYITAAGSYTYAAVGGHNSVSCSVQYKQNGGYYIPAGAGSLSSGESIVFGSGGISLGSSYTVLFTLADEIQSVTREIAVGTATRSFHIKRGGKGIAFGKVAETDELVDSAWPIKAPEFRGRADSVLGAYDTWTNATDYGGKQPPSYVGAQNVRFNMMNGFKGSSDDMPFMDVLMMNAYSWSDIPYATALGIQKTHGVPRAWIAAGKNGDSWGGHTELITSNNIGSQSVNYATSAGNATALGGHSAGWYAWVQAPNDFLHSGNEFTYASNGFSGGIWHNYRTASWETNGNITEYYFGNGKGGFDNVSLYAGNFYGKLYNREYRCGSIDVPAYSTSGSNGSNYYGDVSVSATFDYSCSSAPRLFLQVTTNTTGVTGLEPVSWDKNGIYTIRIHRSSPANGVSGFTVYYLAVC